MGGTQAENGIGKAEVVRENHLSTTKPEEMTSEDFFFDKYAHFEIHEGMLKDEVRISSYRKAMFHNKHLFRGKTVLDVGCGIGILSMFAAQAGAARVIAIESSNIAECAAEIIEDNRLSHIITLIKGKAEEVDLPAGIEKVDIIVSDWMGCCLFSENMIGTVLYARDKWLDKKDGIMFPDRFSLFVAAIENRDFRDKKVDWWDNVYGFDMSHIRKDATNEPLVAFVNPVRVATNSYMVKDVDLYTIDKEELIFSSTFHLTMQRDDYIHALVTYFTVTFTKCFNRVAFSTSPDSHYTRYKQTTFYMKGSITAKKGEEIFGTFSIIPDEKKDVHVGVKISFDGTLMQVSEENTYILRS